MLYTIAVILLIAWLLGIVGTYTLEGLAPGQWREITPVTAPRR